MMQLALEVGQTAKPEAVMFWILGPFAVAAALPVHEIPSGLVITRFPLPLFATATNSPSP